MNKENAEAYIRERIEKYSIRVAIPEPKGVGSTVRAIYFEKGLTIFRPNALANIEQAPAPTFTCPYSQKTSVENQYIMSWDETLLSLGTRDTRWITPVTEKLWDALNSWKNKEYGEDPPKGFQAYNEGSDRQELVFKIGVSKAKNTFGREMISLRVNGVLASRVYGKKGASFKNGTLSLWDYMAFAMTNWIEKDNAMRRTIHQDYPGEFDGWRRHGYLCDNGWKDGVNFRQLCKILDKSDYEVDWLKLGAKTRVCSLSFIGG